MQSARRRQASRSGSGSAAAAAAACPGKMRLGVAWPSSSSSPSAAATPAVAVPAPPPLHLGQTQERAGSRGAQGPAAAARRRGGGSACAARPSMMPARCCLCLWRACWAAALGTCSAAATVACQAYLQLTACMPVTGFPVPAATGWHAAGDPQQARCCFRQAHPSLRCRTKRQRQQQRQAMLGLWMTCCALWIACCTKWSERWIEGCPA